MHKDKLETMEIYVAGYKKALRDVKHYKYPQSDSKVTLIPTKIFRMLKEAIDENINC